MKNSFENLLRKIIKYLTGLYFKYRLSKTENKFVSVSGKVISKNDLNNIIDATLDFNFSAGKYIGEFEGKLSEFTGTTYCLTVNSGSSANLLALTALTSYQLGKNRLKEDDEVITLTTGFPAIAAPIIQNRLIPVFTDINIPTYNIDVASLEKSISAKTKAIFIAHTLGNPFDVEMVIKFARRHNLWIIEDNCNAMGSVYNSRLTGSFGDLSTSSFYQSGHITTGEGGAVFTNDSTLYKILLSLRDHGKDCIFPPGQESTYGEQLKFNNLPQVYDHKYIYSHIGYNFKMTDFQAALGLSQLKEIEKFAAKRKANFEMLLKGLRKFEDYLMMPEKTIKSLPSWFAFPITVKKNKDFTRLDLIKYLEKNKIETQLFFAGNILHQPLFTENNIKLRIENSQMLTSNNLKEEHFRLPANSEIAENDSFCIGIWHGLNENDINFIIEKFEKFFSKEGNL
jgi:CDP-4-dehydro-6-deoxyglucose reductase, E1